MDADFTSGSGDSLSARQSGYRLTHPDSSASVSNPVLTGVETGGHASLGRNGHEQPAPSVQWSSAPVTVRTTAEPEPLPRRIAAEPEPLPRRTPDLDAVPARITGDAESFSGRITADNDPYAVRSAVDSQVSYSLGSIADGQSYGVAVDSDPFASRPATNGSAYAARTTSGEELYAARPSLDSDPVGRRYAPDPEPPARHTVSESLFQESPPAYQESAPAYQASVPAYQSSAPSGRRAAREAEEAAPAVAPAVADIAPAAVEQQSPVAAESKAAEFRSSEAAIDLHHIMSLLVSSHDLEVAVKAAEAGEITVEELARIARRTRTAAVDLVSAWYGGAEHMRKFGEVLLQAAAETA
ncbi:hypothetical protein [Nocardia sp. NBC_00511]|uniref:hypothetical protein n=1 Tax=Nocardia sp. NBC_00511 TaxID=2903591 RepID=UPI0030DEC38B